MLAARSSARCRFPTNNPDFAPFVQKVKDARPDVLFIFVPAAPRPPP